MDDVMADAMVAVCGAMAEVLLDESAGERVSALRISALRRIIPQMETYYREVRNERLVLAICRKKINFILCATTKSELDLIMGSPKVWYDGNKIQPAHQYVIPEEEIIIWYGASLRAPLKSMAVERYMELAKMIFPEYEDIISDLT